MAPKHEVDLADEGPQRRKLVKLDHNAENDQSPTAAARDEDEDQETHIDNADDEEAAAAAARAEKARREERLVASDAQPAGLQSRDHKVDKSNNVTAQAGAVATAVDVDPLDAYMAELSGGHVHRKAPGLRTAASKPSQEPRAFFSDDEDELNALGDNPSNFLEMTKKATKKKDIPVVDHHKINYESFRKRFYTEPSELAEMNEEAVKQLRFELDGIKVRGNNVPKPVQSFSQCGVGIASLNVISSLGFQGPTAIQAQAIPTIMSGRDVIGVAKTGSGKTIAFLLPMFRHIKDQRSLSSFEGPIGLVMTPTRELATQIHKECKPWLKALGLRAVCAYGGTPIAEQIAELKRGAELVVCTPGRMIDLLTANQGRVTNLKRVTYCVLDEADRMFDMGFEPQIMKILNNIRPLRQTVLFSATFPPKMEALSRKALTKPVEIIVGGRAVVAPEIKQLVEVRNEKSKFVRLLELLGEIHQDEDARSLVFVDRQESAEGLMNQILRRGYPSHTIHGAKDQYDRDSVISDFKAGIFPVLVATSVAARGLDVKQLKMVVNYDCPNHLEDYVHRAGRTGRAGNTGLAVTFITDDQGRYAGDIVKALKQSGNEVSDEVQSLANAFEDKVKAGTEKAATRGFGGRGISHLDSKRDAEKNALRKVYRTGDEPEEEEEPAADENLKKLDEIKVKPASTSEAKSVDVPPVPSGPSKTILDHLDLDPTKIKVHKTEAPQTTDKKKDKMMSVQENVAAINARLRKTGDIRGSAPIDNKGPDAGAFHATLEINDFPQKARWAVTNRTNVAKILESTGTSITTKGNYYPEGQMPTPTDTPKLYILVEGDTEVVVTNAMKELMRLLREGAEAAAEAQARQPVSGRYTVT